MGNYASIAIRVSRHPAVRALCENARMAVVSTSANRARRKTLKTAESVQLEFGDEVDGIMAGSIGTDIRPSVIRDAISGAIIRS